MKKILSITLLSASLVSISQFAALSSPKGDGYYQCTVNDPTGTPLNIRATPNGKIIGTLSNGERIGLVTGSDSGKWAHIVIGAQEVYGWVLRAYLSNCSSN